MSVLKRARAGGGDVPAAAGALGVKVVEHASGVQRADDCVRRLDARIATAQRNGDLAVFNPSYRAYRLDRNTRRACDELHGGQIAAQDAKFADCCQTEVFEVFRFPDLRLMN
jgi:hypothetical protein